MFEFIEGIHLYDPLKGILELLFKALVGTLELLDPVSVSETTNGCMR